MSHATPDICPTLRLQLSPDWAAVESACAGVRRFLGSTPWEKRDFAVQLLLRELLNNAVIHGCRGRADLTICLEVRCEAGAVTLVVEDGGEGFDWRREWARERDADDTRESGRGMAILAQYAAGVEFNEKGNRVVLRLAEGLDPGAEPGASGALPVSGENPPGASENTPEHQEQGRCT